MSPSPIYWLSTDLIDEIIDTLVAISEEWLLSLNLGSCALVSRSFLPRSQMHLFSVVKLHSGSQRFRTALHTIRCRQLGQILECSPHITEYVREVYFAVPSKNIFWMFEDRDFTSVVMQLTKSRHPLLKFTMEATSATRRADNNRALVMRFSQSFISPLITSLRIDNIDNVPIEIMTSLVNLNELILINADLEFPTIQIPKRTQRPRLQRIESYESRAVMAKVLEQDSQTFLDITELRSLVIYADDLRDLEFEQGIIYGTRSSLEELSFQILEDIGNYGFNSFIDLEACPLLHKLETFSIFHDPSHKKEDNLATICHILSTIPKINYFENLMLTLYVGYASGPVYPGVLLDANWDLFFTEVTRLASGKPFKLSLNLEYQFEAEDLNRNDIDNGWYSEEEISGDIGEGICSEDGIIPDIEGGRQSGSVEKGAGNIKVARTFEGLREECDRFLWELIRTKFSLANSDPTITIDLKSRVHRL